MASRVSYVLRISGRLDGDQTKSEVMKDISKWFAGSPEEFQKRAAGDATLAQGGAGWPFGFVLRGYSVCEWKPEIELYAPSVYGSERSQTLFNFRTEIHSSHPGSLFENRGKMVPEVTWFYNYRSFAWHSELVTILRGLNGQLNDDAAKKAGVTPIPAPLRLEPIWFREYQWYCGNGGP